MIAEGPYAFLWLLLLYFRFEKMSVLPTGICPCQNWQSGIFQKCLFLT